MSLANLIRDRKNQHEEGRLCPNLDIRLPCFKHGYNRAKRLYPRGTLGIELEVEGKSLPMERDLLNLQTKKTQRTWNVIDDGSLRDGQEYVLSGPVFLDELDFMLEGLFDLFEKKAKVQNSNRCSTHVHVNCSRYKVNQVTSILCFWWAYQEAFINWWGEERKNNHFCLNTRAEHFSINSWLNYLSLGIVPTENYRNTLKYVALNYLPLFYQGSLEFRCGGPPNDREKVFIWAVICASLVRFAASDAFEDPRNLVYAFSEEGPDGLLRAIVKETPAAYASQVSQVLEEQIIAQPGFNQTCYENLRDAQPVIYAVNWAKYLEQIKETPIPRPFNQ